MNNRFHLIRAMRSYLLVFTTSVNDHTYGTMRPSKFASIDNHLQCSTRLVGSNETNRLMNIARTQNKTGLTSHLPLESKNRLYLDPDPKIMRKKITDHPVTYEQKISLRFLQPPSIPSPGVNHRISMINIDVSLCVLAIDYQRSSNNADSCATSSHRTSKCCTTS
jgi:hypothetical protein